MVIEPAPTPKRLHLSVNGWMGSVRIDATHTIATSAEQKWANATTKSDTVAVTDAEAKTRRPGELTAPSPAVFTK